jgi:hypothetical protein
MLPFFILNSSFVTVPQFGTVTPPRLERGTYSLEGCCSIQLSYGASLPTGSRTNKPSLNISTLRVFCKIGA